MPSFEHARKNGGRGSMDIRLRGIGTTLVDRYLQADKALSEETMNRNDQWH